MITLKVNTVDKSTSVNLGSLQGANIINQQTDTLTFSVVPTPDKPYLPEVNDEVSFDLDGDKIFGGVIVSLKRQNNGNQLVVTFQCQDYSFHLNRYLVIERYDGMTLEDIVKDIIDNFTDGTFTYTNVVADDVLINTIAFDRVTVPQAFEKLSKLTNYQWYVDPDKDVHFFSRTGEVAPFTAEDSNDTIINESLETSADLSQIRNRLYVRGGEAEGVTRTEKLSGDGVRLIFALATKFASIPTVTVGGTPQTIGLDFIDPEADFDCFWSFEQKSLRFKTATVPASGTSNILVTGTPLYVIIAQVEDHDSVLEYGVFEYAYIDDKIKSLNEAIAIGQAQLAAYASGVNEGSFSTYQTGLRAGQIITVNSTSHGVNEDFVIQKVQYKLAHSTRLVFSVTLATLRTIGIIQFLISLLQQGMRGITDSENITIGLAAFKDEGLEITDVIGESEEEILQEGLQISEAGAGALDLGTYFVWGPYTPTGLTDPKRVFILNGGSRLG